MFFNQLRNNGNNINDVKDVVFSEFEFSNSDCYKVPCHAYAPIANADEEAKANFYSSLQAVLDENPRHVTLLMGTSTQDFIHKLTWASPDGHTKSQIDHIMINSKWRHSLQSVRAMRHADIGSDHNLVTAKIRLKLRKANIGTSNSKRFDVTKLKDPVVREEFNITLRNRFSALRDETVITIDLFHQAMNDAETEAIGYKKSIKSEWLSKDTCNTIEERKQLKKNFLDAKSPRLKEMAAALYRKKDNEVKKSARTDKRTYTNKLSERDGESISRRY